MNGEWCFLDGMGEIKLEVRDHICTITIDYPRAANAMTLEMTGQLCEAVRRCTADPDIRCAVVTGSGERSFTSGGDIKAEARYSAGEHENIALYNSLGEELIMGILRSPVPFLAAVNGYAIGAGMSLIAACDTAIASTNAVFGLPTISLGGFPGWGCTQLLTRVMGRQNELRMLLFNEKIDAQEALRIGFIQELLPPDRLMERAYELAGRIVGFSSGVVASAKRCVNRGLEAPLSSALALEDIYLNHTNVQPNFREGIAAFLEKRPPDFLD